MRLTILALLLAPALAFVPAVQKAKTTTKLDMQRRDVLITGIMGLVAAPTLAQASGSTFFYDQQEQRTEPTQMATDGRLDLNSAYVVSLESTESNY